MSYATEIEEAAGGEKILGIVIGEFGGSSMVDLLGSRNPIKKELRGKVIPWSEARNLLNYNYDDGFGGKDCHPIVAWTENAVIISGCYDGATWVQAVPRNPIDTRPDFIGGG